MKHIFLLFTFLHLFSIALQSQTTDQKARQIFKSVTNNEPAYIVYDEHLKDFIIAAYRDEEMNRGIIHVDKLINVNGKWRLAKSLETGNGNWEEVLSDTSFILNLDNQRYWCFLTSYRYVATQSDVLSFYLVDFNFEDIYRLDVQTFERVGSANTVSIEYSDNLKGASIQRKYLDELVKKSDKVYKLTPDDLNINSIRNFGEKFRTLNKQLFENSGTKLIKFKPVYYNEKLLKYIDELNKKENVNYIVYYDQNLGLILFDKALRKYTVIYLSHFLDDTTFYFKSTHELAVNYDKHSKKGLIIDLQKFTYNYQ
jgi:hypothetical protein